MGFVVGKFVRKRNFMIILGLTIGIAMGLLSGLEIAPLLYPFMILRIPWVGVPEIRRVGLAFGHPDLVLFSESIHFQSFSLIMMSILILASIVGTIMGVYLGRRYSGSDVETPWETNEVSE